MPCAGELTGGNQRHAAVLYEVSSDAEHWPGHDPDAGPAGGVGSTDLGVSVHALLHGAAGLRLVDRHQRTADRACRSRTDCGALRQYPNACGTNRQSSVSHEKGNVSLQLLR